LQCDICSAFGLGLSRKSGVFFAVTLFFCLIQSAHDGIVNRNRDFDSQRWWYPIYRMVSAP
jgi:hypothetical protein